ncbi:hypothetical protein [Streptomyces sp. Tu 3180]|uniref:hypothetical protein n=1 Tax=Streptomyces sp. Tu 3180 TaxID=2682611 RepID=UPI00135B8011|nr:hypothetical protein [Streptomyces sp. Tu 3180]KAF3465915.1 hypothetical protein GL259_17285 [Streptomyces sp. Tu 3180]
MSEHDTILRMTGAAALTLVAVVCVAGLAEALRRGLGGGRRMRECGRAEAVRRHGSATSTKGPVTAAVPRQRQTGPRAEAVQLTPAERDAFAVLVRRFGEGG